MGNLVIVESPGKTGTIQKYLGSDYVVRASRGHIRDLDEKKLSIDVGAGFVPEYVIPAEKKKDVAGLKAEAKKADMVWLASDQDREGEAIAWHLYETLGLSKEKTRRIVFPEITKTAILDAINNPRDIDMNLVNAQQARRILDRLVGYELSPVLWKRIQPRLSAGRVQSVALRLIVDREREIISFKKERYYKVEGTFHPQGTPARTTVKALLDRKFPDIESARDFLERCIDSDFTIDSIDKKEGTRMPPAPFTTSTLQQEASRKCHMSVSQVMSVAQKLYERGIITYMRTDSTNLSSLAINTAKDFICENYGVNYSRPRQYKTHSKGAQEAHEAIRPTFISNTAIEGTVQEKKLYDLIWKRTVASQMAEAKVLKTDVKIALDKASEHFCLQAGEVLFDGFLKLTLDSFDDEEEDGDKVLPKMNIGDKMERKAITAECKFTGAPLRYSESTLVKKLEELGIGRPSTYAPTISTLTKARGYVVKGDKEGERIEVENLSLKDRSITSTKKTETVGNERNKLLPQDIGMMVTDFLTSHFPDILDYGFTADVEGKFDTIASGGARWQDVLSDFYSPFHNGIVNTMKDKSYDRLEKELGTDPSDGQKIIARYGQYGPFVQKGEGDRRICVSLAPGQIIESLTLEDALKLFILPRNVGAYNGIDIICTKGRFGPYVKYGDKNITLPKGSNPASISFEECCKLVEEALNRPAPGIIADFTSSGIQVLNGRYGPYIKKDGKNYKIPRGTDASSLTEAMCLELTAQEAPSGKKAAPRRQAASRKSSKK